MEEKQYEEAVKQLQQLEKEEAQEHAEYSRLQCHVRSLHDEQSHFAADVDELISRCHKLELEIEDRDENLKKNPLDLVRIFCKHSLPQLYLYLFINRLQRKRN